MFDNKELYRMPEGIETRWASHENPKGEKGAGGRANNGRKGSPAFAMDPGECRVLAEEKEKSGTVRRIWVTIDNRDIVMLRGLKLEFYWDGASKPAVRAPLGDFFGTGLGKSVAFQSALFTNPEGRSFNCYIPMPFKKGMKITVTNESKLKLNAFFYDVDYTTGDRHGDDILYFHACYRRENPTAMQKDYEILPKVNGRGRYLGCNIGVKADKQKFGGTWWGEGEVKAYIDGDAAFPTLCGTGTEDYIGTGWGQGKYDNLYQGCHFADHDNLQYCFYRYHVPDPVFFNEDIRVTIQQIGCWGPEHRAWFYYNDSVIMSTALKKMGFTKEDKQPEYGLFERCDDWSSCSYFYLDSPVNGLPEIDPFDERIK